MSPELQAACEDLERRVTARPMLNLDQLQPGQRVVCYVYPYHGCGFLITKRTPKARTVLGRNLLEPNAEPARLPRAHQHEDHWGSEFCGYRKLTRADWHECQRLQPLVDAARAEQDAEVCAELGLPTQENQP